MSLSCLGVLAGLSQDVLIRDLYGLTGIKRNEPEDAVKKALRDVNKEYDFQPPKPIIRFAPQVVDPLTQFIKGVSTEMVELMEKSPATLTGSIENDGLELLDVLYSPDEILFIGDVFDTKVKAVSEWMNEDLSKFPHIIPNPMTGDAGMTAMAKISYRCEQTVKEYRYAVCEMDEVPIKKQVAFWNRCIDINIPVAAVIHSGSKSLHGWIKVDCGTDAEKWDADVRGWLFGTFGKAYGLDSACQNCSRLSRLPGHPRPQKSAQRLLYLNGDV
jgi:hypothetical protein